MGSASSAASSSEEDVRAGDALVKQVKVYPLAKADNPPAQRLVDMTDILYDGLVRYDESLYASLARVLNEETVQPRDLQMMGMLLPLGIERGKNFKPDAKTVAQLKAAAAEAKAWLIAKRVNFITPWWPNSAWAVPAGPVATGTGFLWEEPNYFDVDSRGLASPTSSGRQRSSVQGASISGLTMTAAVAPYRANILISCTFPRMSR
jgi:hypothetical protein